MEPMKPMKPLEPMKPMAPMSQGEPWWPSSLGQPAASGSQNDVRFAFFPDKRRLLVEKNGRVTTYDTGDHQISGVSQHDGTEHTLTFTGWGGSVELSQLKEIP
jgi:hypothetical protein